MSNPLLSKSLLPEFENIRAEHIAPAIHILLEKHKKIIHDILSKGAISFDTLVLPIELLNAEFNDAWSTVTHLNSVKDTPELRKEYEALLPIVTEYFAEVGQNEELYKAYVHIAESSDFKDLHFAQQKLVEDGILSFKLSGVNLSAEHRDKFRELEVEMNDLERKFETNVMDSSLAWTYFIAESDKDQCKGIPEHVLKELKEKAIKRQSELKLTEPGFLFTLDYPIVDAVLSYADNRELRKEIYTAFNTVASEEGPHDTKFNNTSIMLAILHKRQEQAKLLGFSNYAENSLAIKMVKQPNDVIDFLKGLLQKAKIKATQEFEELRQFAKDNYQWEDIYAWDLRYLNEKLKLQKFDFSEEELRAYFPVSHVLNGLFEIAKRLFGITVKEIQDFQKWHESVRLFEVFDNNNQKLGLFYLDLFVRPHKRHGAWCGDCRSRRKESKDLNKNIQYPVAYIVANFGNANSAEKEAYLTHYEVLTLFHEFGHCLHHVLTKVDYPSISGTNGVEWDAVELPSQFLENWCFEKSALDIFSKHKKTDQVLAEDLFNKIKAAENFQGGLSMIRQIEFALFDMILHTETHVEDIQTLLDTVRKETSITPVPSFNRFQNSFSHIFSGGYAAGYYSYLWSDMLSADAYSLFQEKGIFDSKTGENFKKHILEMGGSKEAMELFKNFRGRAPDITALIKQREL